jgi:hypothetical protein
MRMSPFVIALFGLVQLPSALASNNTFSNSSDTVNTTSSYGTVTLDAKALSTPWPLGIAELILTAVFGLVARFRFRHGLSFATTLVAIYVMIRCFFLGAFAIKAIILGPTYPKLSDGLLPLALSISLYRQRAVQSLRHDHFKEYNPGSRRSPFDNRLWGSLIGIGAICSLGFVAVPSLYLASKEYHSRFDCMYLYTPSDPCVLPTNHTDICGLFSTIPNCTTSIQTYSECPEGENLKGIFGLISSALASLIFLIELLTVISLPFPNNAKQDTFANAVSSAFVISLLVGAVSVGLSLWSTASVHGILVADCRNASTTADVACTCITVNSTSSHNGYWHEWRVAVSSNWLAVAGLG